MSVRRDVLNSRLRGISTSIFAEMSALAVSTGSINLGQGFPDTDGPKEMVEAAVAAIRDGRGNQYPPGPGIPELRAAVSKHQLEQYGLAYDPDTEVLVTAGATEAIAASLLSILDTGDEVIVLEPIYDSYAACIAMAGGVRVPVTIRPPDFAVDLDRLAAAITPRTKVLLLNSPHNPTGKVLSSEELRAVAALACEHDLIVVTDEVYEHLVYGAAAHIPLATLPGMRERTITISSAGKTFSMTGWKIGWVTGVPRLVNAVRTAKQFLTYVSGGPFQYAVAVALGLPQSFYDELRSTMTRKRDILCGGLREAGFDVFEPSGTYFVTTDIRPFGKTDGLEFCRQLPERCGVVAIPEVVFYDNRPEGESLVRFAFCKREEVLLDAVERLKRHAR